MRKTLLLIIFLSFIKLLNSQNYSISGFMKDAETGEELLYANVFAEGTTLGANTNLYGFYSLTLPQGNYTIIYSFIGYEPVKFDINLTQNITKDIELTTSGIQLDEVQITARKENDNVTNTEVSVVTLDVLETRKIPVLLGEQDILKTLQLLPGISASSEGGSGFFVRGGNADQNLILLDEAPVYNASHLLGFFSVFNGDAIKDVKLYKGGIPAQYGGRASSVMDVRMKNGNLKSWGATGGLGLISSRMTIEGPIKKDNGSIMVSGRRTYLDIVAGLVDPDFKEIDLYFYDLNLKANYKIGDKDRIYISGYLGRDAFGFSERNFGFDWGNKTFTTRWNHVFNNKLFSNTSLIYSDFDYGFKVQANGLNIDLDAGIYDYNLKQNYTYFLNPKNTIDFGWNGIYHQFKPTVFSFDETAADAAQEQYSIEGGFYASNTQKINDRLTLNYGLRLSTYSNVGPYIERSYNEQDEIISEEIHENGDIYNNNFNLEPRFSATYLLDNNSSVKASYNRNTQYLHLLSNSTSGTPTDMWISSSNYVKPTIADQVAIGYFRNFNNNNYKFSFETYYKSMIDIPDYEDGAETFGNANIESEIVIGRGRSYGIEFLLEKQKGKFTGWMSYTLSKVERQYNEINNGNWFSARQDRTHDISLVGIYQISPKISLSVTWVYNTGDAVTFPTGKYFIDGGLVNLYSERNANRMPAYHRLDLGLNWVLNDSDKFYNDLNFSVYNAYNRKNAYTISFDQNEAGETQATRLALFGIVPSVTWNFKF